MSENVARRFSTRAGKRRRSCRGGWSQKGPRNRHMCTGHREGSLIWSFHSHQPSFLKSKKRWKKLNRNLFLKDRWCVFTLDYSSEFYHFRARERNQWPRTPFPLKIFWFLKLQHKLNNKVVRKVNVHLWL